jgi:hypothetical protein
MTWRLFLDDERFPVEDDGTPLGNNFIIARTVEEAQNLIMLYGMPNYISFDNDLGENQPEGYSLVKWIVEMDMDGIINIKEDFSFYVHSQNSQAQVNIPAYLNNYLKIKWG